MGRPKKIQPMTALVQAYIDQHAPELKAARLHIQLLDGPIDAPRYAASAEVCPAQTCPYAVPLELAQQGQCTVRDCGLRCSLRLLLERDGTIVAAQRSSVHWN